MPSPQIPDPAAHIAALKAQIEAATPAPPQSAPASDVVEEPAKVQASRSPDEQAFLDKIAHYKESRRAVIDFRYETADGTVLSGIFVSVVPDLGVRGKIGRLRALLSGGVPFQSLDPETKDINFLIATLSYAFDEKDEKFPEWARDFSKVLDEQALYRLHAEVALHQDTFLGRVPTPQGG